MKSALKNSVCLILILAGFAPMLLMLSYDIKQRSIRESIEERIESGLIQKISIPEKDVIWAEDDEIIIEGKMFDIKSFSLEDGIYFFEGLYDEDETKLIAERNEAAGEEDDEKLRSLLKWINLFVVTNENVFSIKKSALSNYNAHKDIAEILLSENVPTPPPQALL